MGARTHASAAALLAACIGCNPAAAQPAIYLVDTPDSDPQDVSASGEVVVGMARDNSGRPRWFRWTLSGGVELVGAADDSLEDTAFGVSGDGSVLVGQSRNRAHLWTEPGGARPLGDLDGQRTWSEAFGATHDGGLIVGTAGEDPLQMGFLWSERDGMTGLGGLHDPQGRSVATAVTAEGATVVGAVDEGGENIHPALWEAGEGWHVLENLPDWNRFGHAQAVSSDGGHLVGFVSDGNVRRAFRWERATEEFTLLPNEVNPSGNFFALDVSDGGRQVVGSIAKDGSSRAVIWDEEHGTRLLAKALHDDYVLDLRGWTLTDARAISRDGSVITGQAVYSGLFGERAMASEIGFVAIVPGPGTAAPLLAMCLTGARRARRASPRGYAGPESRASGA
ncbi:MAG TPA: hypothetical protein VFF69_08420 [Phycisphaerales bacterium]|nr:hypothetical protein [Phycisphaerales bacterium]